MNGRDILIILSQGGTAVASTYVKSHDIQSSADTIEKASPTQQSWREYIAGRKDWSIQMSYLLLAASRLRDPLLAGQVFDVTIKDRANTYSLTGEAILTTCKQTYTVGNLANGSFTLKGNGPLE